MKKRLIWIITLIIGLLPFIIALLTTVYTMIVEGSHWTFTEYLFLYSFIHWPEYVIGIVIIALSLFKLKRN